MKMCWVINLERKILKLETMDYKKYSSFTFIDPYKNIFGFTVRPRLLDPLTPRTPGVRESQQYESPIYRPVPSPQVNQVHHQSNQVNNDFYRGYVDARKKTGESKRGSMQGNYINLSTSGQQGERSPKNNRTVIVPQHLNVTLTPTSKR